ncbi:MAG: hypothetical protein MAG715_00946 [Methanonatronarchaeales archaeon]|nr:hypothetical protein [Methanonatronarchaeales archaeon]
MDGEIGCKGSEGYSRALHEELEKACAVLLGLFPKAPMR